MATKKPTKPPLSSEQLHERISRYVEDLQAVPDPVKRALLRSELLEELKEHGVAHARDVVKAAEQKVGTVSEADRAPVVGDLLNPIRALPDNPTMQQVGAALLQLEASLTGATLTEREILGHRRTTIMLLKQRHIVAPEIVDRTFKPLLTKARAVPLAADQTRQTDLAYAEELARLAGDQIRYVPGLRAGVWYVHSTGYWAVTDDRGVIPFVSEMARTRYKAAAEAKSTDERIRLSKEAVHLESLHNAENVVKMASTLPELRAQGDEFDRDPYLLNVQNGTVDLRTGALRPHRREDYLTKLIPLDYDPNAGAPTYERFVAEIMSDDADMVEFLGRVAGYTLTGHTTEQCMFIMSGTGANGKSTLLETWAAVLDPYAGKLSASTLMQSKHGAGEARNDLFSILGCRLAWASESGISRRLDEERIKEMTGDRRTKFKQLYRDVFEGSITWKIFLLTNYKPIIRGQDHAIWRRLPTIEFLRQFPINTELPAKLLTELPGILAWMVRGCLRWQQFGLKDWPRRVREATAAYREDQDFVASWISDCCVLDPDVITPASTLFASYCIWAEDAKEPEISKKLLGIRLEAKGFREGRTKTERGRKGIRLALAGESVGSIERGEDPGEPAERVTHDA